MVEQQELCIDGSTDADDKIKPGNGDTASPVNLQTTSPNDSDAESANLLRKGASKTGKS